MCCRRQKEGAQGDRLNSVISTLCDMNQCRNHPLQPRHIRRLQHLVRLRNYRRHHLVWCYFLLVHQCQFSSRSLLQDQGAPVVFQRNMMLQPGTGTEVCGIARIPQTWGGCRNMCSRGPGPWICVASETNYIIYVFFIAQNTCLNIVNSNITRSFFIFKQSRSGLPSRWQRT